MQDQKALLDSLMGGDRNVGKKDSANRQSWKDNVICKNFLVWECPHDFFLNDTRRAAAKAPFGECPKQHSEAMKLRFQAEKNCNKYKLRYLEDLELQMRRKIDAMDTKVEAEKSARNQKVEGEKDKQEAWPPNDEQARLKEMPDEMCEVCGTYTSFRGAVIMRHDAGIIHVGWARLRESFDRLQQEIKVVRDASAGEEKNGTVEGDAGADRSEQAHKSRGRDRDTRDRDRHGHGEVDDRGSRGQGRERDANSGRDRDRQGYGGPDDRAGRDRDANSGRDRDRQGYGDFEERGWRGQERDRDATSGRDRDRQGYGSLDDRGWRGQDRDRDANFGRDRDRQGYAGYEDRGLRGRDREQDRGQGSRHDRRHSSRRKEAVDEFGRAKTIANDYRERELLRDKECDRRDRDDRSRSRESRGSGGALEEDTDDVKAFQVPFSKDWEETMQRKIAELRLRMAEWDMAVFDHKGKQLQMDSEETALSIDSFPLKFKFMRKTEHMMKLKFKFM
mmetsp:Transcript_148097/g.283788  ORF Transcript_148097/g.283788 Transcript_148097/m.283788 type:complete len:504 (+) Transcript_148097:68-1579(+)